MANKKTKPWKPRTLWDRKPQTQVQPNNKAKKSKEGCRGKSNDLPYSIGVRCA